MELELEPREVEFRERLEEWLAAVTRPDGLRDFGATPTLEDVPSGRQWQALLLEAGFAGLSWPAPYGPGATMAELAIFAETMAGAELPRQLSFVSMELAGPILIAFGTPAQQDRFLPRLLSGDDIWCQLFSEPGAGSDLAAVATRASKVGDHWEASGQKIWTSGAHYSQYGLLLARTGPKVPPHAGITCFAVRMDAPGIEVRPIRQMDGESKFNEVFLDSVRLTADDVIGAVNGGWKVALSVLGKERRMLGSIAIGLNTSLWETRRRVEQTGDDGEAFREQWARLWSRVQLLRWTWLRYISEADDPNVIDPRTSVLKLTSSLLQQDCAALARDSWGAEFAAGPAASAARGTFLASHGATIAGGTSEIQRNILGERVLRLPR